MPKFSEVFFGKKAKTKQLSTKTKEQQELQGIIDQGLKTGEGALGDVLGQFNEAEFNKGVAEPALKRFKEETLPELQEKFIASNQTLGSGYGRAKLKAGTDLQSRLAELMYNAQNQQKQNRLSAATNQVNGTNFENVHTPGQPGLLQTGVKAVAENAGAILSAASGPQGGGTKTSAVAGGV